MRSGNRFLKCTYRPRPTTLKGHPMSHQPTLDLRGLNPAPITPFTRDGAVDYAAIQKLGRWLSSVAGVKSLTVLGHAGEGTFLERDEQLKVITAFRESVGDRLPIIAGITLEGTRVAAEE